MVYLLVGVLLVWKQIPNVDEDVMEVVMTDEKGRTDIRSVRCLSLNNEDLV